MMRYLSKTIFGILASSTLSLGTLNATEPYPWQTPQAELLPNGDIKWSPKAFHYEAGEIVRYIDYENGDDANAGDSKDAPWKHHPWDRFATGNAAAHEGVTTYVFKGGVGYRGELVADESGEPGAPIILTAPEPGTWGEGMPMLLGSVRLPSQWVPATEVDYPERLPEPDKVWALDLKPLDLVVDDTGGRWEEANGMIKIRDVNALWKDQGPASEPWLGLHKITDEGTSEVLHLARTPDWEAGDPNFAIDYWHALDAGSATGDDGKFIRASVDEWLKGHPEDYFLGGYIWQQYGSFMGGATPKKIAETFTHRGRTNRMYDPEAGAIMGANGIAGFAEGLRYMIENLPQFLDSAGEFYHDSSTGILFYRPENGVDPNQEEFELTHFTSGLYIEDQSHILVNGLSIRFFQEVGVGIEGDVEDIWVRNCAFEDILNLSITQGFDNWRVNTDPEYATDLRVTDCYFQDIWTTAIRMESEPYKKKVLGHIEVLRNKTLNTGIRHKDNVQTPLPAIELIYMTTSHVAGNIIEDSWGSGIMVFSGTLGQGSGSQIDIPLNRHFVHHNKTSDTALAVNDYGGMSLWQGGPIFCFNNNIGNSPGVMPAGLTRFGRGGPEHARNLSYPLYLDGAYKVYSFNNVIWARHNQKSIDPFATTTPGYFMVFGFLNQFANNTLYRTGEGVGGSSGHRNDVVSNLMASVGSDEYVQWKGKPKFIAHDRAGDPSLVGGGDDGTSGQRGVPTLAYAHNVMHGTAQAGRLLRDTEVYQGVEAETVEGLTQAMQEYPIRYGQLGWRAEDKPIGGKDESEPIAEAGEVDFRLTDDSMAIDKGATYYVPFNLYATVGEWHFSENHRQPSRQIDYAWYNTMAHFERNFYEFIPPLDLVFNEITLEDYVDSSFEDWAKCAAAFDGQRYALVSDASMREDIIIPIYTKNNKGEKVLIDDFPEEQWIIPEPIKGSLEKPRKATFADDAVLRYPGELRETLIVNDENLLIEAIFTPGKGLTNAGLAGKFDGKSGYRLILNGQGQAEFQLASDGETRSVTSGQPINTGEMIHLIAEADRETGRMSIYVNGELAGTSSEALPADASLDNGADFLVGKTHDDQYFEGVIDSVRVSKGTLEDARTDIDEVYTWFTNGPWRYDMLGNEPVGRRDAGAIEKIQ